jgi:transposase, IS6 family
VGSDFTAEFIDAARPARHAAAGDRCFVDETYVKVAGRWRYLYRAVDQHGQVIDVLVSMRRNAAAARVFFTRALPYTRAPVEVTTDIGEAAPVARHVTEQYATTRSKPTMHGSRQGFGRCADFKCLASASTIAAGHAFAQNLRRGHYAITVDVPIQD